MDMFKALAYIILTGLLAYAYAEATAPGDVLPKGEVKRDGPCPKKGFLSDPNVDGLLSCATTCILVREEGETAMLAGPANCLECCFAPIGLSEIALPQKETESHQDVESGRKATSSISITVYQIVMSFEGGLLLLAIPAIVVLLVFWRRERQLARRRYGTTEEHQGSMTITEKNLVCSRRPLIGATESVV